MYSIGVNITLMLYNVLTLRNGYSIVSDKKILIIGGASTDTLHLKNSTVKCPGGAGMYTAVSATHCGANVTLFGPRPHEYVDHFKELNNYINKWIGPKLPNNQLPEFEISYRNNTTEYLSISLESETNLSPDMMPEDLTDYSIVHVSPLGDAINQLKFIISCRYRGAKLISAGTGLFNVKEQPHAVKEVINHTDYFFMNRHEAKLIFGSIDSATMDTGKLLYITLGDKGALIVQGSHSTLVPTHPITEIDPTGAGDTFCGAVLANILQNKHPVMAAHEAVVISAKMISQIGPKALYSKKPISQPQIDTRIRLNNTQIKKISEKLSSLPEVSPFPFVSKVLPPINHPKALDYFFAATVHQFSFWSIHNQKYYQPLIAPLGGVMLKGSDYLWKCFSLALERDAEFCSPNRQASLSLEELKTIMQDDNGNQPMPAIELHLEESHRYGRDMLALNLDPESIIKQSKFSSNPLSAFINILDQIGGYKEDPLRKKSGLLALILNQRPENFLPFQKTDHIDPVIDYHNMRLCLRAGLIDILDEKLNKKLIDRIILSKDEEWAIRYAAYCARQQIVNLSGKPEGAIDWFFFNTRKTCPEMTPPLCESCLIDSVCDHKKEMFQPVIRTTYY